MLKKCLKHDLKYVYDVWKIATLIFIPLSVIGGLSMRAMFTDEVYPVLINVLSVIGMMLFYLGTVAYVFVGAGMGMYRYYLTCFTDEGYLTFTLPVRRHTILNSKILSTVIPFAASLVVMLLCFHITFAIAPSTDVGYENMSVLAATYSRLADGIAAGFEESGLWFFVYVLEVIMLSVATVFAAILAFFSSITRSPERKKKPKRSALKFIIYYIAMFPTMMVIAGVILLIGSCSEAIAEAAPLTQGESNAIVALILMMVTMMMLIISALLYRDNLKMIREKLNLS